MTDMSRQELLEELWSSNRPIDILEFYNRCPSVDDLIQFSALRTKPLVSVKIIRPQRKSKLVCVIPTPNQFSEQSIKLQEILKPFPVVLAVSGGRYFNYAHSMNVGIEKALSLDPEWVLLSNDDIIIPGTNQLLKTLDCYEDFDYLIPDMKYDLGKSKWVSTEFSIFPRLTPRGLLTLVPDKYLWEPIHQTLDKSLTKLESVVRRKVKSSGMRELYSKYGVYNRIVERLDYSTSNDNLFFRLWERSLLKKRKWYRNIEDFAFARADVLSRERYDEIFINNTEDKDLSVRLAHKYRLGVCKLRIQSYRGLTLSPNSLAKLLRNLRKVLNHVYFFSKHKSL